MTPFQLRVTFTGLNLFLIQADCKQVAVLQPDCRSRGRLKPVHPDGDPKAGEHHASFLRFNLANLSPSLPATDPVGKPLYEGIYRFANEVLDFGTSPDVTEMGIETGLPTVERIAPHRDTLTTNPQTSECKHGEASLLKLISGLLDKEAPLVMRTTLSGGSLEGTGISNWVIPSVFNPVKPAHTGNFPRRVIWKRKVTDASELKLHIKPLESSSSEFRELILHPIDLGGEMPEINLHIANICSENPLEWDAFTPPKPNRIDRDFKWLYRLLKPVDGTLEAVLNGLLLPVPVLLDTSPPGVENCIGMRMTVRSIEDL